MFLLQPSQTGLLSLEIGADMLILMPRDPPPDAPYWLGRTVLAVVDAIAWPAAWIIGAMQLPERGGLIGGVIASLAVLAMLRRLHRAIWMNHRYYFTTWWFARMMLILLIVGATMKLFMLAA